MQDSPIQTASRINGVSGDPSHQGASALTMAEEVEARKAARALSEQIGRFHAAADAKAVEEAKIAAVAEIRATTDEEVRVELEIQAKRQAEEAAVAAIAAARETELQAVAEAAAQAEATALAEAEALKKAAKLADAGPPLSEILGRVTARVVKKIYKRPEGHVRPKGTIRKVWFYTAEGERLGPVAFKELRMMAQDFTLHPRLDMVWREGMEMWKPAGEVEGLFERRNFPINKPPTVAPPLVYPPLAHPHSLVSAGSLPSAHALMSPHTSWPGARRPLFLFGSLLFPFAWHYFAQVGDPLLSKQLGETMMVGMRALSTLVPVVLVTHLALQRLVNLGMSRWWILAVLVPILNLWLIYRWLVCPAGYGYHQKLDHAGKALAIVYGSLMTLVGLAIFAGLALLLKPDVCPTQWLPLRESVQSAVDFFKKP
jgi:GYF domain 2